MKVVLDVNVLISAALSRNGTPAMLVQTWRQGVFELVVSPLLIAEMKEVLDYPKIRGRIPQEEGAAILEMLSIEAAMYPDPVMPLESISRDAKDNYLIELARHAGSLIVSGDKDLTELTDLSSRILSPARFHDFLHEVGLV